jgi:hypothetical protein
MLMMKIQRRNLPNDHPEASPRNQTAIPTKDRHDAHPGEMTMTITGTGNGRMKIALKRLSTSLTPMSPESLYRND